MGSELYIIAVLISGFAFLTIRELSRRRGQLSTIARHQLQPAEASLSHLPTSLQATALFAVGDGGHERQVLSGYLDSDEDEDAEARGHEDSDAAGDSAQVAMTVFEFSLQRDVRGEWGYLATQPSFRIYSPLTVVAFQLPVAVSHVLIKRRGSAEVIAEDGLDRYASVVDVVRDVSTIDRAVSVPPPATLPEEPEDLASVTLEYLLWAEDAAWARSLLDAEMLAFLRSPAVAVHEVIIEGLGELLLVYCAKDGAFSGDDAAEFVDLAKRLCRHVCRQLAAQGSGAPASDKSQEDES